MADAEAGAVASGRPVAETPVAEMPGWQAARRNRIVEAALGALERQEYERIRIGEVARAAGVALGTLYRYFSSKEHLYAAVLQAWLDSGRRLRGRTASRTPEERVRARVRAAISAFERRPQFFKVTVLLQGSTDPNARLLLAEFATSSRAMLAEEFAVLGPDADDAATMLWSIIHSNLTAALYHGHDMSEVYRIADRFIDLLADRLAAPEPGHRRVPGA
ncbi:TetR/AcrR family transcriptional regulator [Actinomadura sp. SCN-SB]|uniref:TetR/AcrR family transcriptional regulator n=1 Tax=Actinomadura sp. SCN-SB TaxID=3373092 RepID=UPI0037522BDE